MLLIALWWISTSKGVSLNYGDLVDNVQNTFDDCIDIVKDVGNYVDDVASLGNVRRRNGEEDGHAGQLWACVSMLKVMDQYRDTHSRLVLVQSFVHWQEMEYLNQLLQPLSMKIGEMPLYIASKDGDRSEDFHEKCDGKGPTVVIIETTTGNVFGGYMDTNWRSDWSWQPSPTSFIFQLRPNIVQYALKSGNEQEDVIGNFLFLGPVFGQGNDIRVASGALTNTNSYVNGYHYNAHGHTLNNGTRNFKVEDYLVFPAIPL